MKKFGKTLLEIFRRLGLCVIIVLLCAIFMLFLPFILIFNLIAYPFKRFKYKKSSFYKDLNIKFSHAVASSFGYTIYPYIKENPNCELIMINDTNFYLKNKNTIAVTFPYVAKFLDSQWMYAEDNDEGEFVNYDLLNAVKEDYFCLINDIENYQIKLIADYDNFCSQETLELAKQDNLFIIVDNLEEYKTITL